MESYQPIKLKTAKIHMIYPLKKNLLFKPLFSFFCFIFLTHLYLEVGGINLARKKKKKKKHTQV